MRDTHPIRARFGVFELNRKAGELCRGEERIRLQEQPLQILLLLLERDGEIVTREEIKKKLWPNDTIVEFDHSINAAIKNLRRALGDSATKPEVIETVARRGYRLMVKVEWIGADDSPDASVSGEVGPSEPDSGAVPNARLTVGRLTGKVVSHYRVLDIIGGGGMGLIYRAEDLNLGRAVALKFLPEDVGVNAKARERFVREAKAISALNHPNICSIYEFEEHDGHPFIVMELLQGRTLRDQLAAGRLRLTQLEGLEIAIQIASGLEAAHEKGIIHRDIKPANIFITEKNVAKILDFGVAKVIQSDDSAPANEDVPRRAAQHQGVSRIVINGVGKGPIGAPGVAPLRTVATTPAEETAFTRTGLKLGTAGYMSPEQIRGDPLDARTDIFSFGLVLYEMATGERAFTGETEAILHDAIQHRAPRPIRDLAPEITPGLEEVIGKCLEKEPSDRYRSTADLRDALARERFQGSLVPSESTPKSKNAFPPRGKLALALLAVVPVIALAGVVYRLTHPRFKLTDKDTIVLADFENKTGDPVFDDGLNWALRIGLQQTPFLNTLEPDKVARVLSQIGQGQEALTLDRALLVCQKTNSTAVLIGSIADAGNQYDVSIRALRCDTDAVVAQSETTAKERNQIVAEIGSAAVDLRKKLGESNTSIQAFNQPLGTATSSSPEALKLYTQAERRGNQQGDTAAIPEMLQVTERDSSFALAYRRLASYYNNIGELSAVRDNIRKGFDLRLQLTRRERLRTESGYYFYFTGEWERAIGVLQEMSRDYPGDAFAPNNAAAILRALGEPERAVAAAQETIRLRPDAYYGYANLMSSEINRNRWAEAKVVHEQALSKGIDSFVFHTVRYLIAFLERDAGAMQKELDWERTDPRANGTIFFSEASRQIYFGHAKLARKYLGEGLAKQNHARLQGLAARSLCSFASTEAEIGEAQQARQDMAEAFQMSPSSPEVKTCAALLLARLGVPGQAETRAAQVHAERPLGTMENATEVPTLKAAAMLARGNPTEALNVLEPSVAYFRSSGPVADGRDAAYLRGIALLKLKKGQEAALEFQKIIDSPGLVALSIKGALAHVQLARAQVMMGDKEAARNSYHDFFILWKDADPDIPIYKEAKAEYSKLQ